MTNASTIPSCTIRDLAQAANVSPSTASLAISGRGRVDPVTRQRVVREAERLGYRPRGVGRPKRVVAQTTLGILYSRRVVLHGNMTSLAMSWIDAIRHFGTEHGLQPNLMACQAHVGEDIVLEHLMRTQQLGALVLVGVTEADGYLRWATRCGLPVVAMNRQPVAGEFSSVLIDYRSGAMDVAEQLRRLGHRRLALLYPHHAPDFHDYLMRGIESGLEAGGLAPSLRVMSGEIGTAPDGDALADQIQRAGCTAALVLEDIHAIGVGNALERRGVRVPDAVSIVSIDDIGSRLDTGRKIASIGYSKPQMGRTAVELVARLLKREPGMSNVVMAVKACLNAYDTIAASPDGQSDN